MVKKIIESEIVPKFHYDDKHDVLYIVVREGEEEEFIEIAEGINIELDEKKNILGIEILNASRRLPARFYASTKIEAEA